MNPINNSILNSTKKMVGLEEDDKTFDLDLITHINTVFVVLTQIGVGPADGFMIEDDKDEWTSFLENKIQLNSVRSLLFMKVRLAFDPPSQSYLVDSLKAQIAELEWRLNVSESPRILPTDGDSELVWILDGHAPFPEEAQNNDIGIDTVSGDVWRNIE